jgi:nucleoside-diphosphate-sugar epimerase
MALRSVDWAKPIAGVRRADSLAGVEVERRIVDATREDAVARALDGVSGVVNCVAGDPASITEGARALFAAALRAQSKPRIVHLSTMSVYGDVSGIVDESAPLRANLGAYAVAKGRAEQHAASYPNVVILRPGCVYGPESPQWSARVGRWLMARRLGDLGADGDGFCNLVHVDDVIDAIVRSLRSTAVGPFNLSLPDPPTWNEYLVRYGQALRAVPIRRISHRRLSMEAKLCAPPLKMLEIGLKRVPGMREWLPPPLPPSLLRLMRQEIKLDVRRATEQLGVTWTSLEAGLEDTARWYLARTTARLER